jgi:hypothetical protein
MWEWQVTCGKCGYKSKWHTEKVARFLSLWHTLRKHLHGYNTIAAAEKGRGANKARDNFIEAVQEANKPGWKPPSALPRPGRSGEVKGEGHASRAKDLPDPE